MSSLYFITKYTEENYKFITREK